MDTENAATRTESLVAVGQAGCAISRWRGVTGVCVVMAPGLGAERGPGTAPFVGPIVKAGHSVVTFDYRRFGGSTAEPRGVVSLREQLEDWRAVLDFATALPDVNQVVAWGFSLSGGHVLRLAASASGIAAAIAVCPNADGLAAARNASRHNSTKALLALTSKAVRDEARRMVGREPVFVPTAGRPGEVALLTTPDALDGPSSSASHPTATSGAPVVAAGFALRAPTYRPIRSARDVSIPLLVVTASKDQSALAHVGKRVASLAPGAEHVEVPGGHYAPFNTAADTVVAAQHEFISRHTHRRDR